MRRAAALAAAAAGLAPAAAEARYQPSQPVPALCSGAFFTDTFGTPGADSLGAGARAQRMWGMTGSDDLRGSATRASCLCGGQGADSLALGTGGGVAFGEDGNDLLAGSTLDDFLYGMDGADVLAGADGADTLRGGRGIDTFDGGPGADMLDARDRRAEVVVCGDGPDSVVADRQDALIGCESVKLEGAPPRRLAARPYRAKRRSVVRIAFRVPESARAGAYRVIAVSGARRPGCADGPFEVARVRAVRKGQRVRLGLRPPRGGWCSGLRRAIVVHVRPCGRGCPGEPAVQATRAARPYALPAVTDAGERPAEPLARLEFRVR